MITRLQAKRTLIFLSLVMLGSAGLAAEEPAQAAPAVDHILLEVKDVDRSVRFYRDYLGLRLKKKSGDFVMLEAANVGVYLWSNHWKWSPPPPKATVGVPTEAHREGGSAPSSAQGGMRPPSGLYPHFAIRDVKGTVDRLRQAGYKIVADAKDYNYGTEAFVADPDGFVWALITNK